MTWSLGQELTTSQNRHNGHNALPDDLNPVIPSHHHSFRTSKPSCATSNTAVTTMCTDDEGRRDGTPRDGGYGVYRMGVLAGAMVY